MCIKICLFRICLPLFTAFYSLGCFAQDSIADTWTDSTPPLPKYNRLLIIALVPNSKDSLLGVMAEQAMVNQLTAAGINAVSAHGQLGKGYVFNPNADTVINRMMRSDDDGAITLLLLTEQDDQKQVLQKKDSLPFYYQFAPYYTAWYQHHSIKNMRKNTPTKLIIEANMYNFSTKTLLYSARSIVFASAANANNYKKFSQSVIADMKRKKTL